MTKKYSVRIEYRYDGGGIRNIDCEYNDFSEIKTLVQSEFSKFDTLANKPITADVILVDKLDKREKTLWSYNFRTKGWTPG